MTAGVGLKKLRQSVRAFERKHSDEKAKLSSSSSSSSSAATKSRQFPSKISPPSLGGKKVGVFSTRTPHRPNPIGFSLCKLDKVVVSSSSATQKSNNKKKKNQNQKQKQNTTKKFSLLLSGLDIVDGTPILDIKPYVPHYDCVGYTDGGIVDAANTETDVGQSGNHNNNNTIVRVPQWVDSGLRKRRSIVFLPAAEQFLTNLATPSSSSSSSSPSLLSQLRFYGPNSPWNDASSTIAVQHIRNVISEVLTADVRSVRQTAKARRGEFQAERSNRLQHS